MRRAAAAVVAALAVWSLAAGCSSPQLDRDGARSFTADALRASGLRFVEVAEVTSPCSVEGAEGWRTAAMTDVGEISMCVSRDQGRVLSVRDPGMSDAQFARLERHRGQMAADRARPLATGSAVLLLRLLLVVRPLPSAPD